MLMLAAGLVLAGCLAATARQLRFWQNSETLFAHSLAVTKDNSIARNGLGLAFLRQGRVHEAIVQIQKALEFRPRNIEALNNLAWVFATSPEASLRNGARAVELAERADQLSGGRNPAIIGTLAAAYAEAGRFPEAIAAAQRSLQLASVRNDLVRVTALQNRLDHYQAGLPFRDRNLTNRLPQSPAPLK
jgi:Flp pilus assembly protein TadD